MTDASLSPSNEHIVIEESPASPVPIRRSGRSSPMPADTPPSPSSFYRVSSCSSDTSCDDRVEIEFVDSDEPSPCPDSDYSYYSSDDDPEDEELISSYYRLSTAPAVSNSPSNSGWVVELLLLVLFQVTFLSYFYSFILQLHRYEMNAAIAKMFPAICYFSGTT